MNHFPRRRELKTLEYVLHDFLELKASLHPKKTKPLKEFLFSQKLDGLQVSTVEGFLLAQNLVLIEQPVTPPAIQNVVFLSPKDGRIRVKHLSEV